MSNREIAESAAREIHIKYCKYSHRNAGCVLEIETDAAVILRAIEESQQSSHGLSEADGGSREKEIDHEPRSAKGQIWAGQVEESQGQKGPSNPKCKSWIEPKFPAATPEQWREWRGRRRTSGRISAMVRGQRHVDSHPLDAFTETAAG